MKAPFDQLGHFLDSIGTFPTTLGTMNCTNTNITLLLPAEGETLTVLDRDDSPEAKYAELLVLGSIEAIRDSILPDTLTERYNKMKTHMHRACSVSRVNDPG